MKRAIWTLVLLSLAGLFAYGSRRYPGIAQFNFVNFQVSMSIYLFFLLLVFMVVVISLLWHFYRAIMNSPSRLSAWRAKVQEHRALVAVTDATIALHEGRWAHVEKAAQIASRNSQSKNIAALLGAASAQACQQNASAQEWLGQLDGDQFADAKALQMTQIAINQGDLSNALASLDLVSNDSRKHSVRYYELKVQVHAQAQHWHEVLQIAQDKKWSAPVSVKNLWIGRALVALSLSEDSSVAYLQSIYKEIPDEVRADDGVLIPYLHALLKRGEFSLVRRAIEDAQKHQWRPKLLDIYVQAMDDSSQTEQLKMLDIWSSKQSLAQKDPVFLLAAGQLCFKSKIWGQAKNYFQSSLAITPTVKAHYGLAQTYRAMDLVPDAQEEERKAAMLAAVD